MKTTEDWDEEYERNIHVDLPGRRRVGEPYRERIRQLETENTRLRKAFKVTQYPVELRDYFAGLAMQGLLTHDDEGLIPEAARDAYRYADAMLNAREAPE